MHRTYQWLCDLGVIHNEREIERFRKLTVWGYAGWPFPYAPPDRFEVIMRFLALWIFYDDIIEEQDDGIQDKINAAIGGRPEVFPGGSPHYRGWWELGRAYGRVMSRSWMDRHVALYTEWIQSVREECEVAKPFREKDQFPSAAEHLRRRTISAGVPPYLDFVEYQMGWELPEEILRDPDMKRAAWVAAEIGAIVNDLYSFSKDKRNRWFNLVSCLSREFEVPVEEAFHWAIAMHNARVQEVEVCESRLLSRWKHIQPLPKWFEGVHHATYGLARWYEIAGRYNNTHEIDEKRKVHLVIQEVP
jgi:hypothetical protein